jgi:hypothetical protein
MSGRVGLLIPMPEPFLCCCCTGALAPPRLYLDADCGKAKLVLLSSWFRDEAEESPRRRRINGLALRLGELELESTEC